MRVAAVQLQPVIGDIDANLAACEGLADRAAAEGAGVVVADVEAVRVETDGPKFAAFWIQELDPLSKAGWHVQRWHGRRWYRRHVAPQGACE